MCNSYVTYFHCILYPQYSDLELKKFADLTIIPCLSISRSYIPVEPNIVHECHPSWRKESIPCAELFLVLRVLYDGCLLWILIQARRPGCARRPGEARRPGGAHGEARGLDPDLDYFSSSSCQAGLDGTSIEPGKISINRAWQSRSTFGCIHLHGFPVYSTGSWSNNCI